MPAAQGCLARLSLRGLFDLFPSVFGACAAPLTLVCSPSSQKTEWFAGDFEGSTVLAASRASEWPQTATLDTAARGAGQTWSPSNQEPIMNRNTLIEINVQLTEAQAYEFAQFLKRVCFSDYRGCATSNAEAQHMMDAGEQIRSALAENGYAPR
jgi:hypothetical protein